MKYLLRKYLIFLAGGLNYELCPDITQKANQNVPDEPESFAEMKKFMKNNGWFATQINIGRYICLMLLKLNGIN